MKKHILLIALSISSISFAQDHQDNLALNDSVYKLNGVILCSDALIGSKFKAKNLAGSTYFISPEELKIFNYNDINRILRTVPGVNIVEEEGFGIRPSIGLRGTSPTRSSKITLMEDGVLIAPAPYSASAAYYFPTVNRMQSFEILKGGSQIQYGPFTTGGAINMISTQIPGSFSGKIQAIIGNFNTKNTYFNVGDNFSNFGYIVEYNNRNSDGFKKIDYSSTHTGFDGNEYLAKFRVNTSANAKMYQSLTVKAQFSDEVSNETYLGLTETDFNNSPYRRYLGSEADKITTEHKQLMLTHLITPANNFNVTTKAYRNDFSRNWYKLDAVRLGTSNVSLSNILNNPVTYNAEYNAVSGVTNTIDNALIVKANNRKYVAKGIQTVGNYKFYSKNINHEIDFGVRYHEDLEDRFQWVDGYAITNKSLFKTSAGTPGTDANRIAKAQAFASHVLYNITFNKFVLSPGLRYENILGTNLNYGSNDVTRTGATLSKVQNRVDVFIPGFGAQYKIDENYSVFTSLHKGFSPPGYTNGEKEEKSMNYEAGFRYNKNALSGEVIAYYNNFSNLLGADTNAAGGTGSGDQFNAGKAKVKGLEFVLTYNVINNPESQIKLPITVTYTYTDTELSSNFSSGTTAWGTIEFGDEIPYISKNQLALVTGIEYKKINFNISGKFNDKFRTAAGQGAIPANELVKSNFIVDASLKYQLTNKISLMSNVVNLLDKKYVASRVPSGLRPGMPFGIHFGITAQF